MKKIVFAWWRKLRFIQNIEQICSMVDAINRNTIALMLQLEKMERQQAIMALRIKALETRNLLPQTEKNHPTSTSDDSIRSSGAAS